MPPLISGAMTETASGVTDGVMAGVSASAMPRPEDGLPAPGCDNRCRHVRRRRQFGGSGRACTRSATASSASHCSSMIMAQPSAKKGSCCAGQDIHDARRVADHIGIPHYVLDYEQRFRERRDRQLRRQLSERRNADPLRHLQQPDQVLGAARQPRVTSAPPPWRPAITSAAPTIDGKPGLYPRRRRRPRPELLPVQHHARAADGLDLPARPSDQAGSARAGPSTSPCRSPTRPTARTSASCRPGAMRR